MASKRRLKRRLCSRKVRHATWGAAAGVARNMSRSDKHLTPYFCDYCNFFHIGHKPVGKHEKQFERKGWFIAGYFG
jgi:hypothetical protein